MSNDDINSSKQCRLQAEITATAHQQRVTKHPALTTNMRQSRQERQQLTRPWQFSQLSTLLTFHSAQGQRSCLCSHW